MVLLVSAIILPLSPLTAFLKDCRDSQVPDVTGVAGLQEVVNLGSFILLSRVLDKRDGVNRRMALGNELASQAQEDAEESYKEFTTWYHGHYNFPDYHQQELDVFQSAAVHLAVQIVAYYDRCASESGGASAIVAIMTRQSLRNALRDRLRSWDKALEKYFQEHTKSRLSSASGGLTFFLDIQGISLRSKKALFLGTWQFHPT